MHIFLLVGVVNYEGENVEGVFSTKELAEEGAKEIRTGIYDDIYIEKWEVNGKCVDYEEL